VSIGVDSSETINHLVSVQVSIRACEGGHADGRIRADRRDVRV